VLAQHAIEARPANTEPTRGCRRPEPVRAAETEHLILSDIDCRLLIVIKEPRVETDLPVGAYRAVGNEDRRVRTVGTAAGRQIPGKPS
jgi:hypothetical protein